MYGRKSIRAAGERAKYRKKVLKRHREGVCSGTWGASGVRGDGGRRLFALPASRLILMNHGTKINKFCAPRRLMLVGLITFAELFISANPLVLSALMSFLCYGSSFS
jgi:hypothetical protein